MLTAKHLKRAGLASLVPLALLAALIVGGCEAARTISTAPQEGVQLIRGSVRFAPDTLPSAYHTQATMTEVASASTVSLIDPTTGNTVSSSITDASGSFILTFSGFSPVTGDAYVLEAVKGLSVGGAPNRPGVPAVRVRTLLFWNGGWQSLTNSTVGTGITVSQGTTAVADIASLWQNAGKALTLSTLINSVNGSTDVFTPGTSGISVANDYTPVLDDVSAAIQENQDPVADIAYDNTAGTYTLATGVPVVTSISPVIGTPGGNVVLDGANFNQINGTNAFWFCATPAATWSVSSDGTQATVSIPASAYSAPFTLQQPGGVVQTVSPFYLLHGTVGTLAGDGADTDNDGTGISAEIGNPYGLAVDSTGDVYVSGDNMIRKITPAGVVTTLAGSTTAGDADGQGTSASFNSPQGLAVDATGDVYVAETGGDRIREISPSGNVTTIAGNGTAAEQNGSGSGAEFNYPLGITLGPDGNLYVCDFGGQTIRMVTPAGQVTTIAGSGTEADLDDQGTAAEFNNPSYLAFDSSGNMYVTEYRGDRLREISPSYYVSTIAGNGTTGLVNTSALSSEFNVLMGVAVDSQGNVYLADRYNNCVRLLASGTVSTFAGTSITGATNGALANAQFDQPLQMALAPNGSLYVADMANNLIRVITP